MDYGIANKISVEFDLKSLEKNKYMLLYERTITQII